MKLHPFVALLALLTLACSLRAADIVVADWHGRPAFRISDGKIEANGPASFHYNLVSNPGRGVIWINEVFNNLEIRNNHIITRTTVTPRMDGLFGFNPGCDFKTITIQGNLVECEGQSRPLLRCRESYGTVIRNNTLTNVSDTERYQNTDTGKAVGPEKALQFECGVHGEFAVDGWQAKRSAK